GCQHLGHPLHQLAVAVKMALDLDHQRHAAGDHGAEVAERHHPLGRVLERDGLQLGGGFLDQLAGGFGKAAQRMVVMHHGFVVGGLLDVDLDREIACNRSLHRARHVLDDAAGNVVQAAMGDRAGCQPIRSAHSPQATSNTPSTSTAASAGSEATPTVVRAWRPLSPKAATIRSEAPLRTFGPSKKSGAELMKPPRRTTRTTLSRSPSAALTWASRLIAQPRAAAAPSSMVTPAPSLPLAIS